jgi:hypothetical protein
MATQTTGNAPTTISETAKRSAPASDQDQATSNKRHANSVPAAKIVTGSNLSDLVRPCPPPPNKENVLIAEPVFIASWRHREEVNQWCAKLLPPLTPASQVLHDLEIKLARPGQRLGLSLGERAGVVVVTAAEMGEPGALAGALAGDVLVTVGDEAGKIPVSTVQEMVQALHERSEKLVLNITVRRDVWEPHQTEGRAKIGDGSPAGVCGLACQYCPTWWQKNGGGGSVIQVIQLYAPKLGSLVYSTGGGTINERKCLPSGLQKLLGHSRLIKVGINAYENALRIANDFAVIVTGLHNLPGNNLSKLSNTYCPQDLHLNRISSESEVLSYGDWSSLPLSSDQVKYAALSAVVSYWVCACKRGCVWPGNTLMGRVDDIMLLPPVVPTILTQQQQIIRTNKYNIVPTPSGRIIDVILPHRGQKSDALRGHSILVSGTLTTVSNEDFNIYIAEHSALVCGTMMKDLTTLIVSDRGEVSVLDKAAATEKSIPIVDLFYIFDLVRKHNQPLPNFNDEFRKN